jgi:ParB family chromosome partitioning protein
MTGTIELDRLDPNSIRKNPDNPRVIFREEDMDALLRSIEQIGIQVPLSVYRKGVSDRYILIDGERRWKCALKLGLEKVPVIIEPEPTPLENLLKMFNIHNVRVQWDLIAIAYKIDRVRELVEKEQRVALSKKELADLTGVSTVTISRCDVLLALPKKYQKLIWKELEKPKGEQKYTEDLFIEIQKSIKAVETYLPEITDRYDWKELLGRFFRKYQDGTVTNRVDFRSISKIARGEKAGVNRTRILNALTRFIKDPDYSIDRAYEESVADAYAERSTERKVMDVISIVKELDPHDLDEVIRPLLVELRKELDRILRRG